MTSPHNLQCSTTDVAHTYLPDRDLTGAVYQRRDDRAELDNAIADSSIEAHYADLAHDPDPEAWARYDALMALADLRPLPGDCEPPDPGELDERLATQQGDDR